MSGPTAHHGTVVVAITWASNPWGWNDRFVTWYVLPVGSYSATGMVVTAASSTGTPCNTTGHTTILEKEAAESAVSSVRLATSH